MSPDKKRLPSCSMQQFNRWTSNTGQKLLFGKQGKLLTAFLFLLSVAVIVSVIISNRQAIQTVSWQIRPIWLLYTAIFFIIDLLIATWVWHLLVAKLANFDNFRRSAKICWATNLARRIPTPIWYIAGRAILYEKEGVSKTTTSLLSTLELIFFLLSGLALAVSTLPFWAIPPAMQNQKNQLGLLALLLPAGALLFHPRVLEKIWSRLRPDLELIPLKWRDTLLWFFYYILTWVFGALILFSVINLFYPLSFDNIVALIGIWSLTGSISLAGALTISIIGVREISLILLLPLLIPTPIALIVAISIRLVWLTGEALSAAISLKL